MNLDPSIQRNKPNKTIAPPIEIIPPILSGQERKIA